MVEGRRGKRRATKDTKKKNMMTRKTCMVRSKFRKVRKNAGGLQGMLSTGKVVFVAVSNCK